MAKKNILIVTGVILIVGITATIFCFKSNSIQTASTLNQDAGEKVSYKIVDTNQGLCYDDSSSINCSEEGEVFYGQDAQYTGNMPSYTDNGDGIITDNVTGLVWAQELSHSAYAWADASGYCEELNTDGITDWRLPSVKELWSIRDFSQGFPWVDTDYFHLVGDGSEMAQHHSWTSNLYLVEDEYQNEQVQGDPAWIVNDWTGHIKAMSGNRFVRCVSGDEYGINKFADNGDNTVTDEATGLMWAKNDNGEAMSWEEALAYAENATYAGYDDWRLPSIKELQSIADYSGIFPVIDTSIFNLTKLINKMDQTDYPFYWSSTSNPTNDGASLAWFLASGYNTDPEGYDLHGAGSICFDAKLKGIVDQVGVESSGNYVRLVRGGDMIVTTEGDSTTIDFDRVVKFEDGDTGRGGGQGGQEEPDLSSAAQILGVPEEGLKEVLGDPGKTPDFAAAAQILGVTEEVLMEALGVPSNGEGQSSPSR